MNLVKKILAITISAFIALGGGVQVLAEESNESGEPDTGTTITIQPQTPTGDNGVGADSSTTLPDYTYWVFMKASIGSGGAVSYYVEDATKASALDALKVGDADLFTVTKAAGADQWFVTINKKSDNSEFTGEEVAAALATNKSNAIATGTATKGTDSSTISLDYDGYVLIESSLGTKYIVDTYKTSSVQEKNTYPSNTKTEDKSNAEIGEVVTYTVEVNIPTSVANKDIKVVDTISKGLTLATAITVAGDTSTGEEITTLTFSENTDYTADPAGSAKQYIATIPAATVLANKGKKLTLTYTATVNENAVVNTAEKNKAHIEYDNFVTKDVEVEVKTFGFELKKVDKDSPSTTLSGVKFTLTNANGEYYTPGTDSESVDEDRFPSTNTKAEVETDSNGKVTFVGLHAGTYTLTETENPNAGYNLLASAITITVGDNGSISVSGGGTVSGNVLTVENAKGSTLPSTGGMGTTLFYVVGSALVVGAGVLLIARKRMGSE